MDSDWRQLLLTLGLDVAFCIMCYVLWILVSDRQPLQPNILLPHTWKWDQLVQRNIIAHTWNCCRRGTAKEQTETTNETEMGLKADAAKMQTSDLEGNPQAPSDAAQQFTHGHTLSPAVDESAPKLTLNLPPESGEGEGKAMESPAQTALSPASVRPTMQRVASVIPDDRRPNFQRRVTIQEALGTDNPVVQTVTVDPTQPAEPAVSAERATEAATAMRLQTAAILPPGETPLDGTVALTSLPAGSIAPATPPETEAIAVVASVAPPPPASPKPADGKEKHQVVVVPVEQSTTFVSPPHAQLRMGFLDGFLRKVFPKIEILGNNTIDGGIYLLWLQLNIVLVAILTIVCVGVLLPVHLTSTEDRNRSAFSDASIAAVPSNSDWFFFHFGVGCFILLCMLLYLRILAHHAAHATRLSTAITDDPEAIAARRTIHIRNVPLDFTNEESMKKEIINLLPPSVRCRDESAAGLEILSIFVYCDVSELCLKVKIKDELEDDYERLDILRSFKEANPEDKIKKVWLKVLHAPETIAVGIPERLNQLGREKDSAVQDVVDHIWMYWEKMAESSEAQRESEFLVTNSIEELEKDPEFKLWCKRKKAWNAVAKQIEAERKSKNVELAAAAGQVVITPPPDNAEIAPQNGTHSVESSTLLGTPGQSQPGTRPSSPVAGQNGTMRIEHPQPERSPSVVREPNFHEDGDEGEHHDEERGALAAAQKTEMHDVNLNGDHSNKNDRLTIPRMLTPKPVLRTDTLSPDTKEMRARLVSTDSAFALSFHPLGGHSRTLSIGHAFVSFRASAMAAEVIKRHRETRSMFRITTDEFGVHRRTHRKKHHKNKPGDEEGLPAKVRMKLPRGKAARNLHLAAEIPVDEFQSIYWTAVFAPKPTDIKWDNMTIESSNLIISWVRWLLANAGLIALVLFVGVPSIIVNQLSLFISRSTGGWDTNSAKFIIVSFFTGYATTLIMTVINSQYGPFISSQALNFERHFTQSSQNASAMFKDSLFSLVNAVLLPLFGLPTVIELVGQIDEVRQNPDARTWYEFLSSAFFEHSGLYFAQFFIHATFIGFGLNLLDLPGYIRRKIRLRTALTKKDFEAANPPTTIGLNYAGNMTMLAILLINALFMPALLPFGLAYFLFNYRLEIYKQRRYKLSPAQNKGVIISMVTRYLWLYLAGWEILVAAVFFAQQDLGKGNQTSFYTFGVLFVVFAAIAVGIFFLREFTSRIPIELHLDALKHLDEKVTIFKEINEFVNVPLLRTDSMTMALAKDEEEEDDDEKESDEDEDEESRVASRAGAEAGGKEMTEADFMAGPAGANKPTANKVQQRPADRTTSAMFFMPRTATVHHSPNVPKRKLQKQQAGFLKVPTGAEEAPDASRSRAASKSERSGTFFSAMADSKQGSTPTTALHPHLHRPPTSYLPSHSQEAHARIRHLSALSQAMCPDCLYRHQVWKKIEGDAAITQELQRRIQLFEKKLQESELQ